MPEESLGSLNDCYVIQENGKKAIAVTGGGQSLDVEIPGAKTSFGELAIAEFSAQCGWSFNYNINITAIAEIISDGGTISQEGSFAKIETGTNPAGRAVVRTRRALVYTPGVGALARFTAIFSTPQEDSLQLIGIGNDFDGWFFGYHGLRFGVLKKRGGVDEWIYQEDWSVDTYPDLIPQNGNVYQISFQWLGFGMQYFGIENKYGNISNVHKIEYTNKHKEVSVNNPSLPLTALAENIGNASNIVLETPSAVAGLYGKAFPLAFETLISFEHIVTIPSGVEIYLFGNLNPSTWLGKDNRLYLLPKLFAAASEGNKPIVFRVYANPIIATPTWLDVAPNISPLQYDLLGTWTIGSGLHIFTLPIGKSDSAIVDLNAINPDILPDQMFAVTAQSTGSSDVIVGLTYKSRT